MTDQSATIYFDESGYTGNNLLHPRQTVFAYGSVQVEPQEAADFVHYLIRKYNVQNGELKGANLIKFNKGRRALSEILKHFDGRMKTSVSEKKYALAGKFFEYIFEPSLQQNNSLFYNLDFHKFISNILYAEFSERGAGAEKIFAEFESLMRSGSFDGLDNLFGASAHPEMSPMLSHIKEFAALNRPAIAAELEGYVGSGSGKWVLDLTNTALFSLLAQWGRTYRPITAVCDESKPLTTDQELFSVMIGRADEKFVRVGNQEFPITFNLSGPINLVNSFEYPGVQLADCVAAAFAYSCDRRNNDDYALQWRRYIGSTVIQGSVFADLEYLDLDKLSVQRNALILHELIDRSRAREDLIAGMPDYVERITQKLMYEPLSFST